MENIYKDFIIQNEVVPRQIKIIIKPLLQCVNDAEDWGFIKVWSKHYNLPYKWVYNLAKIRYLNKYWFLFKLNLNIDCSIAEIDEKSIIHVSSLDIDKDYDDVFKDDLINKLRHENFFFKENSSKSKQIKIKLI